MEDLLKQILPPLTPAALALAVAFVNKDSPPFKDLRTFQFWGVFFLVTAILWLIHVCLQNYAVRLVLFPSLIPLAFILAAILALILLILDSSTQHYMAIKWPFAVLTLAALVVGISLSVSFRAYTVVTFPRPVLSAHYAVFQDKSPCDDVRQPYVIYQTSLEEKTGFNGLEVKYNDGTTQTVSLRQLQAWKKGASFGVGQVAVPD